MRYYIIAGEASGDMLGAHLVQALKARDSQADFRYWGGDNMKAAVGHTPVRHIRDLAFMGFLEVLAHLKSILGNLSFCKQDILDYHPDVVIGIDYPGFNLKIEQWAHLHRFKTIHYISPNLWAWKKGRIRGMKKSLDLLCYILPFEEKFFNDNQMAQALYVGHPLIDAIRDIDKPVLRREKPTIVLMPGSRRQELESNMPLMVQLAKRHPEFCFIVAGMSLLGESIYQRYIPADSNIEVVYDQTYSLLADAYAAVVCSGTATLETALFNVPQVVCYRGNPLSYLIARAVVSRRIRYISLVNLIADQPIVTELIQDDFNPSRLEQEFQLITTDNVNRSRIFTQYAQMRTLLGGGGASDRTAQAIIDLLK